MGCKFCIRKNGKIEPMRKDGSTYVGLSPERRTLHVEYPAADGAMNSFDIHYNRCPICGDRLGGKNGFKREFIRVKSYHTAKRRAPWARRIAEVDGGFMAFEDDVDYLNWKGSGE